MHSRRVHDLLPLGNWLVDLLDSSEFVFILLIIDGRALAQETDFVLWRLFEKQLILQKIFVGRNLMEDVVHQLHLVLHLLSVGGCGLWLCTD